MNNVSKKLGFQCKLRNNSIKVPFSWRCHIELRVVFSLIQKCNTTKILIALSLKLRDKARWWDEILPIYPNRTVTLSTRRMYRAKKEANVSSKEPTHTFA